MAWDPRTRQELADTLLADWAARAEDADRPIDVREGAPYWLLAQAAALLLESQEFQLDDLAKQIIVTTASTAFLDRHGAVDGLPRDPSTAAVLEIQVSGTATMTVTFGSATLTAPNGQVYTPSANVDGSGTSVVLDGSGKVTAYATARIAGDDGNQPILTPLTWSAAPTNSSDSATVTAIEVAADDAEADGPYALRILARRQERPASGNRADWQTWATDVTGVADAVVYPLLHATYGTGTLGAVTVIPLGPAQGDSPTNTRVIDGALADVVAGYIEGTNDADGAATATGTQLRPVTMAAGDYAIEPAGEDAEDLDIEVNLAASVAPPFAYDAGYLVLSSPTPDETTFSLVGDLEDVFAPGGTPVSILVPLDTTAYRGGYYQVTPTSVTYDGATNTDFVVPSMPGPAIATRVVLPGLPNFADMRTSLFTLFDQLGPGDTSPACRWPGEESRLRSTLYKNALIAQLVAQYDTAGALSAGVAGVLNATVNDPSSDVEPAAKTLVTLGVLSIHEA